MKKIILALTVILMGGTALSTASANAAPAPASVIQTVAEIQDAGAGLQLVGGHKRYYKHHYYKHHYYKPYYYKQHDWYPPYKGFCYDYPRHWWCKKYFYKNHY